MKTFGILLVFTGVMFLISCNKEEVQVQPNEDLTTSIGYWHNIAVASTVEDAQFNGLLAKGTLTVSDLRELIMKNLAEKDNLLFDIESMRSDLSWSDDMLMEYGILPAQLSVNLRMSGKKAVDAGAVFSFMYQRNEIGKDLYENLMLLNRKVESNSVSQQEIVKLCRQLENLSMAGKEKNYVEVFNQVLCASADYWGDPEARKLRDNTIGIIWADAAGGLYGMLCGPVCSILEGALFSTLVAIQ